MKLKAKPTEVIAPVVRGRDALHCTRLYRNSISALERLPRQVRRGETSAIRAAGHRLNLGEMFDLFVH